MNFSTYPNLIIFNTPKIPYRKKILLDFFFRFRIYCFMWVLRNIYFKNIWNIEDEFRGDLGVKKKNFWKSRKKKVRKKKKGGNQTCYGRWSSTKVILSIFKNGK